MFPLPEAWSEPEVCEDVILADEIPCHRAGLSSRAPTGEEIVGAAVDRRGSARWRAWFELLERIRAVEAIGAPRASYELVDEGGAPQGATSAAVVFPESDAPDRWRHARSNGVAIHAGWAMACRRALWELAERDRVLRAWHGEIVP